MDRITRIFKQHFFAITWFLFYILLQLIVIVLGSIISLILDENFRQIYINGMGSDLTNAIYKKIVYISYLSIPVISLIVISVFLISLLIKKNTKNILKSINISQIFKYILFAFSVNIFLNIIISLLPITKYTEDLSNSVDAALSGSFVFVIISTGILVPIMEEVIFRYGICYNLSKINKYYGLILSALIFGIMHGNLIQSSYAFVLGLIFGYINQKEKSLLPSIIMHASINSLTVLMTFLNPVFVVSAISIFFIFVNIFSKRASD